MEKRKMAGPLAALLLMLAVTLSALWPGGAAAQARGLDVHPFTTLAPLAPDAGPKPSGFPDFPEDRKGQTAVGVQVTPANLGALSYEVPLYVTLAVVNTDGGGAKVVAPSESAYYIRNTSGSMPDGGGRSAIVVTSLEVEALGDWKLTNSTPSHAKEMKLSIGGVELPELTAKGETKSVSVNNGLADCSNQFFETVKLENGLTTGGYVQLVGDKEKLNLPLEAEAVPSGSDVGQGAAAQFRLTYTISLLDADGNPIGVFYDGPKAPEASDPGGATP